MYRTGSALTFVQARKALEEGLRAIASGETVFDLAAVTEVDSTAVATLLAWQRAARARGSALSILNAPASIGTLTRLYGVDELLPA